MLEQTH
jgi:hypothetical protein